MMKPMIELRELSKYYKTEQSVVRAIDRINLQFHLGEFVVITGESGSGKSTLLNVLSGLDTYEEGELLINGEETSYFSTEDFEAYRKQYIGFVFQNYNIIDSFTVYQNVYLALVLQGYPKRVRHNRTLELIEKVGLTNQTHQKSSLLSGGQKQRVSIARALAKNAPIIVADEPTGNLDQESGTLIASLLKELSKEKLVIVVTHNYPQFQPYATHRVHLFDGKVIEDTLISPSKPIEKPSLEKQNKTNFFDWLKIGFWNLIAQPKRLLLTIFMYLFLIVFFIYIYGNTIIRHEQASLGNHPLYENPLEQRLIVTKKNQSTFTNDELEQLKNIRGVKALSNHDIQLEQKLYVQRKQDLRFGGLYTQEAQEMHSGILSPWMMMLGSKLPKAMNEVVIDPELGYSLGDTVQVQISIFNESGTYQTIVHDFVVVGFMRLPRPAQLYPIYFHSSYFDNYLFVIGSYIANGQLSLSNGSNEATFSQSFGIADDVLYGKFYLNPTTINHLKTQMGQTELSNDDFLQQALYINYKHRTLNIPRESLVIVEENQYNTMINRRYLYDLLFSNPDQITVWVANQQSAQTIMNRIDSNIYHVYYPFLSVEKPSLSQTISAVGNSLLYSTLIMIVMYYVVYLSLRNMMYARKKDIIIFRSIGATKLDLDMIVILEMFTGMLIPLGFVGIVLIINHIAYLGLPNYILYFTSGNYLFILFVMILTSYLIGIRFNQKIFKHSVMSSRFIE